MQLFKYIAPNIDPFWHSTIVIDEKCLAKAFSTSLCTSSDFSVCNKNHHLKQLAARRVRKGEE